MTRVGSRRSNTPAVDLYRIASRERPDDGATILHVGASAPTCSDCGHGRILWAEGGYVSWHRICDVCGSHWDEHSLGMGIALVEVPAVEPRNLPPSRRPHSVVPSRWIDGQGWVALDLTAEIMGGRRESPEGIGRTWGELLALVTEPMRDAARADRARTMGVPCVPACWLRRARFYEGRR